MGSVCAFWTGYYVFPSTLYLEEERRYLEIFSIECHFNDFIFIIGGRLKKLVNGIQFAQYALTDKNITLSNKKTIPSKSKRYSQNIFFQNI